MRITRRLSGLAALLLATACSTRSAVQTPEQSVLSPFVSPPPEATESGIASFSSSPPPPSQPESSGEAVESGTVGGPSGFAALLTRDARHFATAPLRWGPSDWTKLGIGMAAVGGAMLLDEELRDSVENNSSGTTRRIAKTVGHFGAGYSWGVLGGFFLAGTFLDDDKARAVAEDGLASSLIAGGAITQILKMTVGRRRPSQTEGTFALGGGGASFPSGHTTQAFAVASVVASHYDSPWVKVAAYGLAGLVGFSRMEENAHYASDVLAGALIGIFVGKAVVRLHEAERFRISVAPSLNPASPGAALTFRTNLKDVINLFRDD